ncbi:TetR/AcrR family transcriptional regulator [Litoribrevibacter albus]|uniref:TetR family transcriptional regulator n=1 Tax=Litoribrevibacter albus TaxID=1473156 RepID=A0AA37SEB8_9GAMM|nr:TetR/AcrR family transcriptional regulator [Litoribrevibacter albus]GLQ32961.1 TetR family transcriptional regulator [Litoribrevibacter albus]
MARRFDHSSEEICTMALHWVRQYLEEDTAENLSLRKIAKGIGYSPGTLINLFGSYSYLLLRVNADTLDKMSVEMTAGLAEISDPQAQLEFMALSYLNYAMAHPQRWRLVFELRLASDEDIPDWQQQRIDALLTRLKAILSELNPDAADSALEQTARVIWAGVHGISFLAVEDKLFSPSHLNNSEMISALIRHYLTGWISNTLAQ